MALKIRLSRGGTKKRPFYRIVVAEASSPRDGRYVERVGYFDPMLDKNNDKRLNIKNDRIKHWLNIGAKPTERVHKLLATVSLMDPIKLREQPIKSAPGKKRKEREEAEAKAKNEAAEVKVEEAPQADGKEETAEVKVEEAPQADGKEETAEVKVEEAPQAETKEENKLEDEKK